MDRISSVLNLAFVVKVEASIKFCTISILNCGIGKLDLESVRLEPLAASLLTYTVMSVLF